MKDLSIKNFVMILTMMVACVNQTSCITITDPPSPEPEFSLLETSWSYTDRFEEGDIDYRIDHNISFPSSIHAKYIIDIFIKEGTQISTSQTYNIYYTYTYNNGFVIMNPIDTSYTNLEGEIISKIEMKVIDVSSGETIGTFYKN